MKNMHGKKLHKSSKFWGENKGFTLVELMVVLVVMMIVAGVSAAAIINWQHHTRVQRQNENAKTIFTAASNQLTSLNAGNSLGVFTSKLKDSSGAYGKNCTLIDVRCLSDAEGTYYNNEADVWTNDATYSIVSIRTHKGDYSKLISGTLTDEESKLVFKLITDYITDGSVLNSAIAIEFSPEAGQVFAVCCSDSQDYLYYDEDFEAGQPRINERTAEALEDKLIGFYGSEGLSVEQRDPQPLISAKINAKVVNDNIFGLEIYTGATDVKGSLGKLSYEITMRQGSKKYQIKYTASSTSNSAGSKWNKVSVTITPYRTETALDNSKKKTLDIPAKTVISGGMEHLYLVLDGVDIQAQTGFYNSISESEATEYKIITSSYSFTRLIMLMGLTQENITFKVGRVYGQSVTNHSVDISEGDIEYPGSNESNTVASSPMFGSRVKDGATSIVYSISSMRHFYNIRYIEECNPKNYEVEKDTGDKEYVLTADCDWKRFINEGYLFNSYSNNGLSGFPKESGAINIANGTNVKYPSYVEFRESSFIHSNDEDKKTFLNADIDYAMDASYGIIGAGMNDENSAGLFIVNKGKIENIELSNINVTGRNATGALCACNEGIVDKIALTGNSTVVGGDFTGGLIGINEFSSVLSDVKIEKEVIISGKNFTGGLAGINKSPRYGKINIQSKEVRGQYYVGGVFGGNITFLSTDVTLEIENGCIPSFIKGYSFVGGVIGYNSLTSKEEDINSQVRRLYDDIEDHVYSEDEYHSENDFDTDTMARTSVSELTGKKLTIVSTLEGDGKYKAIVIPEYKEENGIRIGMEAISHAAGVIGFNSKYSEVVIDVPVNANINGKETHYTYTTTTGTGTVKYTIYSVGIWPSYSFELTKEGNRYRYTLRSITGYLSRPVYLICKDSGLGTDAEVDDYFTESDLKYLARTGKTITAEYGFYFGAEGKFTVKRTSSVNPQPVLGTVHKGEYYGGVVAENYGTITQNGDVTAVLRGEREIGGVIAENKDGAVFNIASDVNVDVKSEGNKNYNAPEYIEGLNAGGLVARNEGEVINVKEDNGDKKFVNVTVKAVGGQTSAGGAIGINDTKKVLTLDRINIYPDKDCEALGDFTSSDTDDDFSTYAGGVVGLTKTDINITNCVNQVDVKGRGNSGGIVGTLYGKENSYVVNCFNSGNIESEEESAGGIIGIVPNDAVVNNIYITSCVNAGFVDAPDVKHPSGIVSSTSGKGTINSCRNYGIRKNKSALAAGITYETAKEIAYCLDGAGKNDDCHISSDQTNEYLNFYFGEEDLLMDYRYKVVSHKLYGYYKDSFNGDSSCYFNTNDYKATDDGGEVHTSHETNAKPCHITDLSGNIDNLRSYLLDKSLEAFQNPDAESYPDGIGNWNLNSDDYIYNYSTHYKTYLVISNEIVNKDGVFLPIRVDNMSVVWNNTTYNLDESLITSKDLAVQRKADLYKAVVESDYYANPENLEAVNALWNKSVYFYSNGNLVMPGTSNINQVLAHVYYFSSGYLLEANAQLIKNAVDNYFEGDISGFQDYAYYFYLMNYIDYKSTGGNDSQYYIDYWNKLLADLEAIPTMDKSSIDPYITYEYQIQVKTVDNNGYARNGYYYRTCTLNSNEAYKVATLDLSDATDFTGDAIDISKVVAINVELRGITTNVSAFKDKVSIRALWWTPDGKSESEPMSNEIAEEVIDIDFTDAIRAAVSKKETALTSYRDKTDDTYYVRVKGARTGIKDLNQDPSPVSNNNWTKEIGCNGMEFEDDEESEDKDYIKFLENIKNSGVSLAVQPSLERLPLKDEYIHN